MGKKISRISNFVIPAIVILLFLVASISSLIWIESQKISTMENDTAWFESYFKKASMNELSKKQKEIIQSNAEICSSVSKDAGVTINIKSVCGNGYYTYCKVDVQLPNNNAYAVKELSFDNMRLISSNDNRNSVITLGSSFQTLEDDNIADNLYSFLICTKISYYYGKDFVFDNGLIHTLQLENLNITDESGQNIKIIGKWDFGLLFPNKIESIEMIREPILVSEFEPLGGIYYESILKSFVLTEFASYCEYEATSRSDEKTIGIRPVVIMKDGKTVIMISDGGTDKNYSFKLPVPISLDEVAFVKLTDEVVIPFSK